MRVHPTTVAALVREAEAAGRASLAQWSQKVFDQYCSDPLASLCGEPAGQGDGNESEVAAAVVRGYLALVVEGMGRGYVKASRHGRMRTPNDRPAPGTLMEVLLSRWAPAELAGLPPGERLPQLAAAWNLCEGVMQAPEWVHAYLMTRLDDLGLQGLEQRMTDALAPLMSSSQASWSGPFHTTVLNPALLDAEFLPGAIRPLTPQVIAVADRRGDTVMGFALEKRAARQMLGPLTRIQPDEPLAAGDAGGAPDVSLDGQQATINGTAIELPWINAPAEHCWTPSGFLIVTAVDSQRLWIVESEQ